MRATTHSLAFGPDKGGIIGGLEWFGLRGVGVEPFDAYSKTIPHQVFMLFQLMFAIITPALISGAIVERMRFRAYVAFIVLWATFVYDPLAHWVWGAGGWLAKHYGAGAVYVTCAVLSGLWLAAALRMRPLPAMGAAVNEVSSLTLSIASGVNLEGLSEALAAVRGVREAEVLARERIARLKVVPEQWDEGSVRKLLSGES